MHRACRQVYKDDEYEMHCWHSILADPTVESDANIFDQNFFMFMVPAKRIGDKLDFYARAASYYAWQAEVLQGGVWPEVGFEGKPFLPGSQHDRMRGRPLRISACIIGWHGDCKARKLQNAFRSNYQCTNICDCCMAKDEDGPLSYRNASPDAPGPLRAASRRLAILGLQSRCWN